MKKAHGLSENQAEGGFILITSLIFLVVLVLLAVSAVNSSALQTRMAGNQQARLDAFNLADSAVRYVEDVLASDDFWLCRALLAADDDNDAMSADCDADIAGLRIMGPAAATETNYFLGKSFWSQAGVTQYKVIDNEEHENVRIEYVVENLGASGNSMTGVSRLFRITARARGQSSAGAVVQSLYRVAM